MNTLRERVGWICDYWRAYRAVLPVISLLTVANAAVLMVYPLLLGKIIESVELFVRYGARSSAWGHPAFQEPVRTLSLTYLLVSIAALILSGVTHFLIYVCLQYTRARQNMRFQFSVRVRLFEHLLELGRDFFARFRTGDLVTRLNDDVNEKLAWYMCSGIARVFEALLVIFVGIAAMLWLNPLLTLYTAGPLPVLIGLFVFTGNRLHDRYSRVQESISELNDSLESCFSGIRVIKAFAAEPSQQALVEQAIDRQRDAEVQAVRYQTVIDSLYGKVWQLAIVGVLLAGGGMVMQGELSLGELIAFNTYVLMLVFPMFDVGQFLVRGRLSAVSIDRLDELERFDPDRPLIAPIRHILAPPPPPQSLALTERRPLTLELQGASYRYPDQTDLALQGVSFTARPGTLTAIAGEVGCGKSTVLQLIPRLLDPVSGSVRLGGQDLRDWDIVQLRQSLGYVPQEAVLLSGTVEENIHFGRDWITAEDIRLATEIAHLSGDLQQWPGGLQTLAGSRGVRLSGGQKQRVALARAIAGKPAVLLLDDCTASLDARTEEEVWGKLLRAIPDCTTLLVTHRPATLERADQIVVLDQGQVREIGTFAELNRDGTLFHSLYLKWILQEDWGG